MINCYREQDRRGKREVVFSDLPEAVFEQFAFASYDEYFAEEHIFYVDGFNIPVKSELLAKALTMVVQLFTVGMGAYHTSKPPNNFTPISWAVLLSSLSNSDKDCIMWIYCRPVS